MRKSGLAFSATTDSFQNSLCSVRYGSSSGGALLFCSQARHWLTHPVSKGAPSTASRIASTWAMTL